MDNKLVYFIYKDVMDPEQHCIMMFITSKEKWEEGSFSIDLKTEKLLPISGFLKEHGFTRLLPCKYVTEKYDDLDEMKRVIDDSGMFQYEKGFEKHYADIMAGIGYDAEFLKEEC